MNLFYLTPVGYTTAIGDYEYVLSVMKHDAVKHLCLVRLQEVYSIGPHSVRLPLYVYTVGVGEQ